jgi:phage shock protein PspC (stress-responsive transcriptional regulator)
MLGAMSDERNAPGAAPPAGADPGGEGPRYGQYTAPAGTARRALRRDRDDHRVAGVCGGLGRYLDMDPVIFRVLFGVLIFFGGFGLLVYAAIWLFVPMDGESRTEAQKLLAGESFLVAAAASLLLVLGLLAVLNTPVRGLGHTTPVIVLALMVAAVPAVRARRRRARSTGARPAPGGWGPGAPPPPAGPEAWWQHKSAAPDGTEIRDATPDAPGPPDVPDPGAPPPWGAAGPGPAPGPSFAPYPPPAPPRPVARRVGGLAMAAALVVLGVGGVLASAGAIHVGWARGTALTVMVLGAAMAFGGLFGRTRWLIPFGVIATVPLIVFSALQVPLQGETGPVTWHPAAAASLAAPYQLAGGDGTLDLTSIDPHGRTVHVTAQVGAGDLQIIVPRDATITASVHLGVGKITFPGIASYGGLDVTRTLDAPAAEPSDGTIALTLTVGAGNVEVNRADA